MRESIKKNVRYLRMVSRPFVILFLYLVLLFVNVKTPRRDAKFSGRAGNGEKWGKRKSYAKVMHPWGLISVAPHKRRARDRAIVPRNSFASRTKDFPRYNFRARQIDVPTSLLLSPWFGLNCKTRRVPSGLGRPQDYAIAARPILPVDAISIRSTADNSKRVTYASIKSSRVIFRYYRLCHFDSGAPRNLPSQQTLVTCEYLLSFHHFVKMLLLSTILWCAKSRKLKTKTISRNIKNGTVFREKFYINYYIKLYI